MALFWVISALIFEVTLCSFLIQPQSQVVEIGTNITLTCQFSIKTALVLFEHNTTAIRGVDSDEFYFQPGVENASLLLRDITLSHSGEYYCRAIISARSQELSQIATITIAASPTISSNHIIAGSINTFTAGTQFNIPFVFTGNPEPNFVLFQLSQTGGLFVVEGLANGNVFSWLGRELIVNAPLPRFSGFYRVQASNQFGTEEFDFNLQFTAPDTYGISRIETYPDKDFFSSSEILILSCITQQPNVIGSWYKRADNGDLIVNIPNTLTSLNNGNLSLEFLNLSKSDSGSYVCRLTSSLNGLSVDEAVREITVFENLSDKVPKRMEIPFYTFGENWIVVNWTEPDSPKPITTYHLNITVISEDQKKVQTIEKDFPSDLSSYNQTELTYLSIGFLHIIEISASNQFGRGISSIPINLEFNLTEIKILDFAPIVGGGLAAVLILIGSISILCYFVCFRCYVRKVRTSEFKQRENMDELDMSEKGTMKIKKYNDDPNGYIVTSLPPSFEVTREGIELQDIVEETNTTISYRATIENIPGKLEHGAFAKVKLQKGNATNLDLKILIGEMELMATIGCHTNVIGFLGACTTEPLYVITEYLPFGDLLSYLRASRGHHVSSNIMSPSRVPYFNAAPSLTPADLLSFAIQIANGMKFLNSKHVIHSKLCAKNITVGEDKMIKIDCYGQYKRNTPNNTPMRKVDTVEDDVMIKWCAPESYFEKIYSNKSDVWSYGVLLWEIVTIGATPYPGVKINELYTILSTGYRMEKPQQCPHELYLLMLDTWMAHPDQRPTFHEIHDRVNKIIRGSTMGDEKSPSGTSTTDSGIRNFRL